VSRDPLSEIAEMSESHSSRCKVREALEWLDEDLRGPVETAISENKLTGTAIAAWLTREGFPISERSVQRHRRHNCGI
jgi:arsenate reductase-like glutaredoxin family protein